MRIITGSAKGFKLKAPKGLEVRPTGDRVKESLFNILADKTDGAAVLDLFAGTGNLGLEALSRGANSAIFVDNAVASLNIVKENAQHTRLQEKCQFWKMDVLKSIARCYESAQKFDLIFCDPPYNKGYLSAVMQRLEERNILCSAGILVFEHSRHETLNFMLQKFKITRSELYGETVITLFQYDCGTDTKGDTDLCE